MTNSYKTGTVSVTNGSAAVNGTGTAWAIENVVGGMFRLGTFEAEIITATNTQLTLDTNYTGATASGQAYRIWLQDAQAASNITINRQLGEIIARLVDSAPEIQDFLDAATAGDALTALGVSTFIKTLLNDANASDAQTTLGVSTFIKTLLDDANQSTALATLGANNASNLNTGIVPDGVLPSRLKNDGASVGSGVALGTKTIFGSYRAWNAHPDIPVGYQWTPFLVVSQGDVGAQIMPYHANGKLFVRGGYNLNATPVWSAWAEYLSKVEQDALYPRKPQTAAGNGQFVAISTALGAGYTLPSGGAWAYCYTYVNASGQTNLTSYAGVAAGGTLIAAGVAGYVVNGWAWRISE